MAYYLVKYNGNSYANRDLVKARYGVGDAGVFNLVADGKIAQEKILDCFVFKLPDDGWEPRFHVEEQDLDAQLSFFSAPSDELYDTYPIDNGPTVYHINGIRAIRISDIRDPAKYRKLSTLPSIRFLGKHYIALGVAGFGGLIAELAGAK